MNPRLIDFLIQKIGATREELNPKTRLAQDLGCCGLDAVTLFNDFFTEFRIQNIEQFDEDLHIEFSPDYAPRPFYWLKNLLKKDRRKYLRPDVTVGHLDRVIELGYWLNEK
jgi:hypothetical protein